MEAMKMSTKPWTKDWVLEHLRADRSAPNGPLMFIRANDGRLFVACYAGMGALDYILLDGDREALVVEMLEEGSIVAGEPCSIPDYTRRVSGCSLQIASNKAPL